MMSVLARAVVYGIVATALVSSAHADPSYFRRADRSLFNATTRQSDFPRFARCVSIRMVGQKPSGMSAAFLEMRFTIIGSHGVRFEDARGLDAFFAGEPTGDYTIISENFRIVYRHVADRQGKWRQTLMQTLSGQPVVLPPAVPQSAESGELKTSKSSVSVSTLLRS